MSHVNFKEVASSSAAYALKDAYDAAVIATMFSGVSSSSPDHVLGADNATDLGASNRRFKDLYLSGGVYLGGTGSANKLDDYEEGTFTPTLTAFSANGTPTYTTQHGSYVKVGNLVHIQIYLTWSNWTGYSGYMKFGGLPFTVKTATSYGYSSATLGYANNFSWGGTNATPSLHFRPSNTEIFIGYSVSGGGWTNSPVDTSGDIIVSGTYFAA